MRAVVDCGNSEFVAFVPTVTTKCHILNGWQPLHKWHYYFGRGASKGKMGQTGESLPEWIGSIVLVLIIKVKVR
jgi:hypothetical protein